MHFWLLYRELDLCKFMSHSKEARLEVVGKICIYVGVKTPANLELATDNAQDELQICFSDLRKIVDNLLPILWLSSIPLFFSAYKHHLSIHYTLWILLILQLKFIINDPLPRSFRQNVKRNLQLPKGFVTILFLWAKFELNKIFLVF